MSSGGNICGDWVELREQAGPGEFVFAPITADLPPARGRRRLVLTSDGRAGGGPPGPDDRLRAEFDTEWSREGDTLIIASGNWAGRYRIAEARPDRLVLFAPSRES